MRLETTTNGKSKKSRRGNNHSDDATEARTVTEVDSSVSRARDNGNPGAKGINPESKEEREKRLAARKARTLKAFQTTYENRHRKAS